MPFPQAILALAKERRFWTDFFFDTNPDYDCRIEGASPYPQLHNCAVDLTVAPGTALVLALDRNLSYFSLQLRCPGLAGQPEIAWDDRAHWHPHVLKWEELDLIGRCVALSNPSLPHPGLPVVLLHRFAPLCNGDDADIVCPLLECAYRSLGLFNEREIADFIHGRDARSAGFSWKQHPEMGWYLDQEEDVRDVSLMALYTMRHPECAEFPFAAWRRFIDATRQTCHNAVDGTWLRSTGEAALRLANAVASSGNLGQLVDLADALARAGFQNRTIVDSLRDTTFPIRGCSALELLLHAQPGSVVKKAFGPARQQQRTTYWFCIEIPLRIPGHLMEDELVRRIRTQLDTALRQARLGTADFMGGRSVQDERGRWASESTELSAITTDDMPSSVRLIREVLHQNGAPRQTTISLRAPTREEIAYHPESP